MDDYDFLSIERHEQNPGSHYDDVKNLVVGLRFIREGIPATEIQEHMPPMRKLEAKLNSFNEMIGQGKREWIQEVMKALDNEPVSDETTNFNVFEFSLNDKGECVLFDSGVLFEQNIIAEEWIRESGNKGSKYIVLKIIETK